MLRLLLNGGHSAKAGYLAGAFRRIGRPEIADEIVKTMKSAGYDVRESDPFASEQTLGVLRPAAAPIVGRLQAMWQSMRDSVISTFPKAPGLPKDKDGYLRFIDEIYQNDAYHSLSIEGYSVTPMLIERVRGGGWDPTIMMTTARTATGWRRAATGRLSSSSKAGSPKSSAAPTRARWSARLTRIDYGNYSSLALRRV